jgi:hypothetical protein
MGPIRHVMYAVMCAGAQHVQNEHVTEKLVIQKLSGCC